MDKPTDKCVLSILSKLPDDRNISEESLDAMSEDELTAALKQAFFNMTDENDDEIVFVYLDALKRKRPIPYQLDKEATVAYCLDRLLLPPLLPSK